MKKFFAIMAIVAFSTVAMANPFSDVPFTHWAYDAVAKLSARGIITGFPDGTFKGNKTMTRYELAMVVARLMARMEDTKGKGLTKGDYATLEKLTVEFADELALLGVKVTALEDEVAMVRDDLAAVKHEVAMGAGSGQGKVKITGEMRADYLQRMFDKSAGSYITKTTAPTDRPTENLRQRSRFYIDSPIDEDVTYHVTLQYGYNNWGAGAGEARNFNTGFEVKRAYVKVNDFFGWADTMIAGRQTMKHANDLLYFPVEMDGVYADKTIQHFLCHNCQQGGGHHSLKLSAYGAVYNTVAEDLGLNIWSVAGDFDLHKDTKLKLYYAAKNDHNNMHNPGGSTVTAGGTIGTSTEYLQNGQYWNLDGTYTTNYVDRWRNVVGTEYFGFAINGNIYKDLTYYGEFAQQGWKQRVMDPAKVDGNSTIKRQYGYIVGLDYVANRDWSFNLKYRYHGRYFEPLTATRGVFGDNLFESTEIGEDFPTVWSMLNYTRDFTDLYARANYKITKKASAWMGYEQIMDKRTKLAGEFSDDIRVWSLGLKYWYKKNTFFQAGFYNFDGKDSKANAFTQNNVGATARTAAVPTQNLHLGQLFGTGHEEDQQMLRMEMQIRF